MAFNALYKNIFDKNESDIDSIASLQQIVKDHPYFTLAHFFLLNQTDSLSEQYNAIAAKTALHFNNPFLLQELLQKETAPVYQDSKDESAPPFVNVEAIIRSPEMEQVEIIQNIALPEAINEERTFNTTREISEPIEQKQQEIKEEEPMIFEPLFATDYFASQGIKLRDEILPADKLGKQLKSFTDWLKTMKKVHESKLPAGNEALDISVQALAEKSNQEEDVLTETMAEVFLQQGKLNKAKEIYEKLSLLNPSKFAYFAAKIEHIQ